MLIDLMTREPERYPRPLLDKLGVKPGLRVALVRLDDASFRRQLGERGGDVSERPRKDMDLIFFGARVTRDLLRLASLKRYLKPSGAIWVVRPKGRPAFKETDVIAAAKAAGLVDIKVVSFSETSSALKLVIPLHLRGG